MKRTVALSILFTIAFSCVTSSCKRKEVIETRLTRLTNKWKLVKTATDSNGNGGIDPSEIQPVQDSYNDVLYFNPDNSGTETVIANSVTTVYPFTWTINDQLDTIVRNGVGHNTIKYYLKDITSITMELTTTTSLGIAAYYYERR